MHTRLTIGGLLLCLVFLGTGASVRGISQANQWQRAGDTALVMRQPEIAYLFYTKVVETFPKTPHSKVAAARGNQCVYWLRLPGGRVPSGEDLLHELYDTLTW